MKKKKGKARKPGKEKQKGSEKEQDLALHTHMPLSPRSEEKDDKTWMKDPPGKAAETVRRTIKARWSPKVAAIALALLLGVFAASSGAAQEQGSSIKATEKATRKVTHHQTTALSRFLSDDARHEAVGRNAQEPEEAHNPEAQILQEARPASTPSKTQNRDVVPLWRICWGGLGVGLFLVCWRTSGLHFGRTPATAGWRTVRAEGLFARRATGSDWLWKPLLRLNSGTGSGSFERSSCAWGAGRADLPGGRSAPAAPA